MKSIVIKGIEIGAGMPKIAVPIVEKSKTDIVSKAAYFETLKIDIVEWRVDFYEDSHDVNKVLETLRAMRTVMPSKVIIFTFRTQKEGGAKAISMEAYTALNIAAAESGLVEIIDVELFSGDDIVRKNIEYIHGHNAYVIASNHEFLMTPEVPEIVSRLLKMQNMDADICKIAVMPTNTKDVLKLLEATNEMYENHADRPLVTMSMSAKGLISRFSGELFGSALTFGAIGQTSAPGQIPVEKLEIVLDILHDSLK